VLNDNINIKINMKKFYHLVINNLFSLFANNFIWFGLFFWVYIQTNSVIINAFNAAIFAFINTFASPLFGKLLDKYNKKNIFIYSHILSIVMYIISYGLYINIPKSNFVESNPQVWFVILMSLIGVVIGNVRAIGMSSLVTTMVDEANIEKANGLVATTNGVSFVFTSTLSGLAVAYLGVNWIYGITVGILVAVIIDLVTIAIPQEVKDINAQTTKIRDSLKYILGQKILFRLIMFTTLNNFIGGVFQALADAYGLSLVSVQTWGLIWGFVGLFYIIGGLLIAKIGLGKSPLKTMIRIYIFFWVVTSLIAIQPSIILMVIGFSLWMLFFPFIEACEQSIIQKKVPNDMQGRVFGLASSIENASTPLSAFVMGLVTQIYLIPFMTNGLGAQTIGSWFGTGQGRGIGLAFVLSGIVGLIITLIIQHSNWLVDE
jgi:MFS transporter, DHA3 family, multidrug efflux protein